MPIGPGSGAGGGQARVEDGERLVDLVGGRDERRDDPDDVHVRARGQDEEVPREDLGLDPLGQVRVGRAAVALSRLDELEREHQPEAAHVADRGVLGGQRSEAGEELGATLAGVGDEALVLDDVERRVRRRAGDDVAAVRAAVAARRQAAMSSRRARMPDSGRPEAMPLAMTRMSGSTSQCCTANISPVRPKPGLDLVGDRAGSRAGAVISRSRGRNVGRRDEVAALAEDRLDDDRRDPLRVDQLVEREVELGLPVAGAGGRIVRAARLPGSSTG